MRFSSLLFMLLFACSDGDGVASAELASIRTSLARHEKASDELDARARQLSVRWRDVVVGYESADLQFRAAEQKYQEALRLSGENARSLAEATALFETARQRWLIARYLIEAAAVIDASHLDARNPRTARSSELSCDRGMSTADFRALLARQGRNLAGVDVDHIVPHALGGEDHPSNYQLLPSSLNRSLGATWNAEKCGLAGPQACAEAVAVSRACGGYVGGIP
jgi:hypothetical protein